MLVNDGSAVAMIGLQKSVFFPVSAIMASSC